MRDPITPAEWQEAANGAHCWLLVDSAIQYGLMTGPRVNGERCEEILKRAAQLGIAPEPEALDRFVAALTSESRPAPLTGSLFSSGDRFVAALASASRSKDRRGRKSMGAEERNQVSARMKKYWRRRKTGEEELLP